MRESETIARWVHRRQGKLILAKSCTVIAVAVIAGCDRPMPSEPTPTASPSPGSAVGVLVFPAAPVAFTGPVRDPSTATVVASAMVPLSMATGERAFVSGSEDGTADWGVDNFLFINGRPVCTGLGIDTDASARDSCFGAKLPREGHPGVPFEEARALLRPVDVSRMIPPGAQSILFELRDAGGSVGNTAIYISIAPRR